MKKIHNLKLFPVTGNDGDAFVGVRIIGNEIELHYPEAYFLDPECSSFIDDIIYFLRTISLAKTNSNQKTEIFSSFSKDTDSALLSYLWIIADYLTNGIYTNRVKTFSLNNGGRVNWKKTIQLQPIVSNGNIIYPNMVTEDKRFSENILVEIYKYCVKKSVDSIGWLFNLNASHIVVSPYSENLRAFYIHTLSEELERTFDDVKKTRLNHMMNVIRGLSDYTGGDTFEYGVEGYHYVFERMIDSIFGTEKNLQSYSPDAEWHVLLNNIGNVTASKLCPDTILIWDNRIFILDSKYYRFGTTGDTKDLPETTSIHKQITYGEYIRKYNIKEMSGIYNAFILPYNKRNNPFNLEGNLEYLGFAKSNWKDNDEKYQIIHSFLIDLKHVINTWNKVTHIEDIQMLINEIVKNSEAFSPQ